MIPYGKHAIDQQDIDAVINTLRSDFITQGSQVPAFEEEVCRVAGVSYGLAVNSATSALHIACLSLGLTANDYLWTSPITFVASSNCGRMCGAKVDFVDIDPRTYNLCPKALEKKLVIAKTNDCLPKIVVVVHLAGQSCDMEAIARLSKIFGFSVIEDASHAIGGMYQDKPIGNCQYSDITVFSFHPVKIITTAEGGVATTNNRTLAEKMDLYRAHGITRSHDSMVNEPDGAWYYEQQLLGFNYRMNDIQASLGLSQLTKLRGFIGRRHLIADVYNQALKELPIILPYQNINTFSAYHLYIIRLDLSRLSFTNKAIFDMLRKAGIGVNLHYIPVYKHPYYQALGFGDNYCSEAESYYQEAISLPIYPTLTESEQQHVIHTLTKVLSP